MRGVARRLDDDAVEHHEAASAASERLDAGPIRCSNNVKRFIGLRIAPKIVHNRGFRASRRA